MTTEQTIILIYFVVFAIINLVLYLKLSKYWYMSAGVTKKDVAAFMSEHITDRRYTYLIRWLRGKTKNPQQFSAMLFFLVAAGFFVLPAPSIGFIMVWSGNMTAVKVFMVIEAVGTALIASLGFSYGKKIEAETETYYSSSQYKPYEGEDVPEEIDDLDELYEVPEKNLEYSGLEPDEVDRAERKKFIAKYTRKLIIVALLLFCLFSPIILKDFNFKTFSFNTPDTQSESVQSEYNGEESDFSNSAKPEVNITTIRELLIKDGYSPKGNLDEVSREYPDFLFEDCLVADDMEIHFEYFKLVNSQQANGFKNQLQGDVLKQYGTGTDKDVIAEDKTSKFSIYTLETDEYYAGVVCEGDGVLYVRCDKVSETWMKVFLYDLGYLKDF